MFNFLKKKKNANTADKNDKNDKNKSSVVFKIDGMHCSSCSMSIDGELEDLDGVFEAKTSYAKQQSKVSFDESKVSEAKMKTVIEGLGYKLV